MKHSKRSSYNLIRCLITLAVLTTLASPLAAQVEQEFSDDFPRLEIRGRWPRGIRCVEETRKVCLPEGCTLDLSRSHSTSQHEGGFGQGGPGYGIFISSLNRPGGGNATYHLDAASRCLISRVKVCGFARQRGWYEGRHVIYGRCQGDCACSEDQDCALGQVCETTVLGDCDSPRRHCVPGCRAGARGCAGGDQCSQVVCKTCPCPDLCESLDPPISTCKCPEGHWYDNNRQSCVTTACESVPGLPDGDKGGGYFAWSGHLFIDTPGADCGEDLTVTATPTVEVGCDRFGGTKTEVEIQINGGSGPYTCQGPASNFPLQVTGSVCLAKAVPFGTQTFTIVDANGQEAKVDVVLKDAITLQAGTTNPPSCCDCADGSASVIASGDNGPFSFRWNDPAVTQTIEASEASEASGLAAGTYSILVSDQQGCFRKIEVTVPKLPGCSTSEPPVGPPDNNISYWRLGQLQVGRIYPTTVTAKNINCKGKRDFEVSIEDTPWFRVTGPTVLRKIRPGKSLVTEAAVDLRNVEPGEYRGRMVVRCLNCPPRCKQSQSIFELQVTAE